MSTVYGCRDFDSGTSSGKGSGTSGFEGEAGVWTPVAQITQLGQMLEGLQEQWGSRPVAGVGPRLILQAEAGGCCSTAASRVEVLAGWRCAYPERGCFPVPLLKLKRGHLRSGQQAGAVGCEVDRILLILHSVETGWRGGL